jgi:predicted Zn-dependent protease
MNGDGVTAAGRPDAPDTLDVCDRILDLVGGRAEAEVTVSSGRSALTRFANSAIHQNVADDHRWARLKVVVGGRTATAGTNRLDPAGLARLVERSLEAARLRPVDPGWPGLAPPAPVPAGPEHYAAATHHAPPDVRAEVVRHFVEQGRAAGLGGAGFCSTTGNEVAFANSAGQRVVGRASRAVVEGIHRTPTSDGKGYQIDDDVIALDGGAAGRTAAEKALASAEAVDVEPGPWEVVLEPPCVSDMLDFLTGQGFNAKHHLEGMSFVRLGEAQFDPAITIYDDATDARAIGLLFDAEGTPRRRLDLVVGGVSAALAHDRRTAARAGAESTGHAVPGGESAGAVPTDVFLAPGSTSREEMIASVERGLLVTDFWYTRILDPKTQVVTGLTRNGTFLIERGEVVAGVRNLRFTQSYADALAPGNVLGVGSDGRLAGEAEFFAPSLHLRAFNFTGGARG